MAHRDRASAVREIEHERDARIDGREVLHRPIVMAPRGGEWTLSVDAAWQTLDAALVDTLGSGRGSGRSRSDEAIGAVWVGRSKSF